MKVTVQSNNLIKAGKHGGQCNHLVLTNGQYFKTFPWNYKTPELKEVLKVVATLEANDEVEISFKDHEVNGFKQPIITSATIMGNKQDEELLQSNNTEFKGVNKDDEYHLYALPTPEEFIAKGLTPPLWATETIPLEYYNEQGATQEEMDNDLATMFTNYEQYVAMNVQVVH